MCILGKVVFFLQHNLNLFFCLYPPRRLNWGIQNGGKKVDFINYPIDDIVQFEEEKMAAKNKNRIYK